MNKQEHLQWCKDRANEYVDENDITQAFASFTSDMGKHQETASYSALELGTMLLFPGHLSTAHQMREWINGFN